MTNTQDKTKAAEDNRFNGWTNYETWAVALWIDNDYAARVYWNKKAEQEAREASNCEMVRDGLWTTEEATKFNLSTRLKEEITDAAPDLGASVYSDLLGSALDTVNWLEISINILEALDE